VAEARSVRREHPFAFSACGDDAAQAQAPLITGVIDLLAQESDGGYLVLDYKSDRVDAQTDLAALVERDYALQRDLYALAVLHSRAERVEVMHWFLERPNEWVATRFHAHDRDLLSGRLRARISHARERPFAVSSQPHRGLCLTCPGRGGLCSWGDAQTLRENPEPALVQPAVH